MSDNYPELLADLLSTIAASLIADGIDAENAGRYSHTAAETIRKEWGGQMIYISKGQEFELSKRDQEIWDNFNGRNHRALCHDYDVSIQWLYKIIKYQHAAEVKRRQTDVFE